MEPYTPNSGDYVKVMEDNDPSGRYLDRKGVVSEIIEQDGVTLYLVEIDINSGDQGTCLAKRVEPTSRPV